MFISGECIKCNVFICMLYDIGSFYSSVIFIIFIIVYL